MLVKCARKMLVECSSIPLMFIADPRDQLRATSRLFNALSPPNDISL